LRDFGVARATGSSVQLVVGHVKFTSTEEQTIVRYILDLNSRGFAPHLSEVANMADKLLGERGGKPVGKCWALRFVTRSAELKMAFN
jgi:hypothetical protein